MDNQRTITLTDLTRIIDTHPKLSEFGYDHPDVRDPAKLDQGRRALLAQLDDVQAAHAWLGTLYPAPTDDGWPTSYGLKHDGHRSGQLGYVTNGAMIAAALIAGLPVRISPHSPNPAIGINLKAPRPQPEPGSFTAWLYARREEGGPVGDLARDVERDDDWPLTGDYQTYLDHVVRLGASDGALRSLQEAWTGYSGKAPEDDHL